MDTLNKYGFDPRIIHPFGTGAVGVMIVGEAPGEQEANAGQPFFPGAPAGSVLERAIKRLGMRREQFVITNVVPRRPPNNWLEGAPWEAEAVAWGRDLLTKAIEAYKPRCILALGAVATRATTGLCGRHLGISHLAGFVLPSGLGPPVVPYFHPSFMRRGAMGLFGYFMRAIKLAVVVAREGRQPTTPSVDNPPKGYIMYPTEAQALEFEARAKEARYLAYDIETPYSTSEDEAEEAEGTQTIKSIQFSVGPETGIFLPWREPFHAVARRILHNGVTKLCWNGWRFDNPVLRSVGCDIAGEQHDLMWAWHHSQPDLPRGLQFAAAQQGWPWPWKHLDGSSPQFYGIVDVDVLQWMVA